jgi:hypothetical protein
MYGVFGTHGRAWMYVPPGREFLDPINPEIRSNFKNWKKSESSKKQKKRPSIILV